MNDLHTRSSASPIVSSTGASSFTVATSSKNYETQHHKINYRYLYNISNLNQDQFCCNDFLLVARWLALLQDTSLS